MRIFLSYGHDSNEPLVQRIMLDLKNRGHDVWFDKNEIKTGDDWRREITEGITSSDKFVSFLSKHSTRDPGVCLDEIAIAIGVKGGNIQTILVESEGEVQPPASISHIQWLDMHDWKVRQESNDGSWDQWYGERFAEIVRVVESDESKRFSGEIETLSKMLCPVSSDSRISDLLRTKLVGREWLASEVELWRTQARHSRVLWISAAPGVGKSVFAANLAHWLGKGTVIATEFCQWNSLDHRDVNQIVRNLAFQIACRLPDYRKLLLTLPEIEAIRSKDSDSAFKYLLVDQLNLCVSGGRERYLILIDALDEAGTTDANPLAELLARNADGLPDWIGLIVTSRPESGIETPFQMLSISTLDAGAGQNLEDIRRYIVSRLVRLLTSRLNADHLVARVVELSGGIFLYAQQFCEAAVAGHISLDSPEQFPKGLSGIFFNYMNRSFPNQEDYRLNVRQLLRLILAAFEPLPTTMLATACEMNREETEDRLRQLGSLFPIIRSSAEDTVRPFHRSIADWLADPSRSGRFFVDTAAGHRALADYCKVQVALPSRAPAYAIRHAVAHLRHCGAIDEALHICRKSKFNFLRLWLAGSGINLVESEIRLLLSTSIAEEQFCVAAKWLVLLRWLRKEHDPIKSALSLLIGDISQKSAERSLSDLSRISDPSLPIAIAFLASLRSNMLGQHSSCMLLLRWISSQSTLRDSLHVTPGIEAVNSVFQVASSDFEGLLLSLPIFDDRHHELFSLAVAWQKSQSQSIRQDILSFLTEDTECSVNDYKTVEFVVIYAIMAADTDLCLASIRWIAKCPRSASIESLPLLKLSSNVPEIVTEFLSELCKNSRLAGYPSVQADVCAMVLLNEEYETEADASRRLEYISQSLGINAELVKASLVRLLPLASGVWQMSPRTFLKWIVVRRGIFAPKTLVMDSENTSEHVQLFRHFANSATTILRWISANAEGSLDLSESVAECMKAIRDICQSAKSKFATDEESESEWDLLCQLTCDNAEKWLVHHGFYDVANFTLSNPANANQAILQLVLSASDEAHDQLTKAWMTEGDTRTAQNAMKLFLDAERLEVGLSHIAETDFPSLDDDLSMSTRLVLFKTVAELAGEQWSPRWTLGIGRKPYSYKPTAAVDAYAKRLRERIVEVAETHGWYPCLLQLSRNLAFLSGDNKLTDSEIQTLVVPAVEAMDASLVVGCPNDVSHRPSLTALTFCDKLPEQFARTLSAMELVDDGLIWHVSRELCGHRQSEQFRDSVSIFRRDLTRFVQNCPPRLRWHETRSTHQQILDRAIAPLVLLIDEYPTDVALDWISDWRNRRDFSKFIGDHVSESTMDRIADRVIDKGREKLELLLGPLLKRRRWDLVYKLFAAIYVENRSPTNLHVGFDEEPQMAELDRFNGWRDEFESIVGMKPNEGLNYGIPNLAKKTLNKDEPECETIVDCRNAIRLNDKWDSHLSNLGNREGVNQGELIRSLLVAAIRWLFCRRIEGRNEWIRQTR